MKVLLIDPKRIGLESYLIIPSYSLGYISTALRRAGHEPSVCNAARDGLMPEQVAQNVARARPHIVGISIFTPYFSSAAKYAEAIRRRFPEVFLVAGGPHAIFEPEEIFERIPSFDFVVSGEGEETLPMLAGLIEKYDNPPKSELENVPNLVFRDGEEYFHTPRKIIGDISTLDPPAWDLIEPNRFSLFPNGIFTMKKRIAPIITSRGCPFPCTFCGAGRAMGKKVRHRNAGSVISEIETLHKEYGIEEIHIMDDNFVADRAFAIEVCEKLIEKNMNIVWACPTGVRLDCLDDELVATMKRAGCYSTAVGIESGSQQVLDLMKKKLKLEMIPEKIDLLRKHGIRVTGFFILGFPGETISDMKKTIELSMKLNLNRANFFNFTPFPGSDLFDRLRSEGKLKSLNYDETYIHSLSYCDDSIPHEEFIKIQRRAHFRFYLRPSIVLGLLRELHSFSQLRIIMQRSLRIIFPGNH
ncbi:MAG TPA: radical SAM protein [bacterium]|nr:radical SAM protein [bacterium]